MNYKEFYEAPAVIVLVLKSKGIICGSPAATMSVTYHEEDL